MLIIQQINSSLIYSLSFLTQKVSWHFLSVKSILDMCVPITWMQMGLSRNVSFPTRSSFVCLFSGCAAAGAEIRTDTGAETLILID